MEINDNIAADFENLSKDQPEFAKKCLKIAQDITDKHVTIAQLVEQLQSLLVDGNPANRAQGTWVLTQVLEHLPTDYLDAKQLTFIVQFYADRLKDHNQTIPAVLRGVLALSQCQHLPDGSATQILQALSHNVSCQQQQCADRMNIYKIFQTFLEYKTEELCQMDMEFVYLVISAVDGERDPKNLMFVFTWYPKFLNKVRLKHLTEEAFEVMSCYFPVDFKAPPQDPNGVTREMLADQLAHCLCAIPEFAEFCIPLALEKLDSSLETAKMDALTLLKEGCSTFDVYPYVQHATPIWSLIHKQVLHDPENKLERACFYCLMAVIKKISHDNMLATIVHDMMDTVQANLMPDSKLYDGASRLLLTVTSGSAKAAALVVKRIAPIMLNLYEITTTPAHKAKLLTIFMQVGRLYAQYGYGLNTEELKKIPTLCFKATLAEGDLCTAGFQGIALLCQYMSLEMLEVVCVHLMKLIVRPPPPDMGDTPLHCLRKLALLRPTDVYPHFTASQDINGITSLDMYLKAMNQLTHEPKFTDFVIDTYLKWLGDKSTENSRMASRRLSDLVTYRKNPSKLLRVLLNKGALPVLISWGLKDSEHYRYMEGTCNVIRLIVGYHPENQEEILKEQLPIIDEYLRKTGDRYSYILYLEALLSSLRSNYPVDYKYIGRVREIALTLPNDAPDVVMNVTEHLITNLLNKCVDEGVLDSYLDKFDEFHQYNAPNYIRVLRAVVKALVMRDHPRSGPFIDKLIALLKTEMVVAPSFEVVMNDSFAPMNKHSHCNRKLLYRQKFVITVVQKLNDTYESEGTAYGEAVVYLMRHSPRQVILAQFDQVLKFVIICLDKVSDVQVLKILLPVLNDFLTTKEKCIEDHLEEFLIRLLTLAETHPCMEIRSQSLQCIREFPHCFPVYKLLPLKQEVLRRLGTCIDDKKRLVRQEAVEARSSWFLLDAPI